MKMNQPQGQDTSPTPSQTGFASLSECTVQQQPLPFYQLLAVCLCFIGVVAFLVYFLFATVEFLVSLCFPWLESDPTASEDHCNRDSGVSEVSGEIDYPEPELYCSGSESASTSGSEYGYDSKSETEMGSDDPIEDKISIGVSDRDVSITSAPEETTPICAYCYESIDEKEPAQPCGDCKLSSCRQCIRAWFMLALKEETYMPPRCCRPIPLAIGRTVLTPEEVGQYKEKHDEWSTASRCYCPLPTCSAFLPPRLFPELCRQLPVQVTGADGGLAREELDPWDAAPSRSVINCPKCTVTICVKCVQVTHADRACARDEGLTSELIHTLENLGTKRCPKCRAAVRKSHGCKHMRCRCGAQWCWNCRRTVVVCRRSSCADTDSSEGPNEENYSSDESSSNGDLEEILVRDGQESMGDDDDDDDDDSDLGVNEYEDGIPGMEWTGQVNLNNAPSSLPSNRHEEDEGSEGNENDEPDVVGIISFNCTHDWKPLEETDIESGLEYECEYCWRDIFPSLTATSKVQSSVDTENRVHGHMPPMKIFDILNDNIMLQCKVCYALVCNQCRDKR